jgi:hypothetical protein
MSLFRMCLWVQHKVLQQAEASSACTCADQDRDDVHVGGPYGFDFFAG